MGYIKMFEPLKVKRTSRHCIRCVYYASHGPHPDTCPLSLMSLVTTQPDISRRGAKLTNHLATNHALNLEQSLTSIFQYTWNIEPMLF